MKILVTGGAGYIGSVMTKRLIDDGLEVVVADSLESGHRETVDKKAIFEQGNLLDRNFVQMLFDKYNFDGVIHFAGYISMGESMEKPAMYFENNTFSALNLLEEMRKNKVDKIIFSSTAGVYGNPEDVPIPEDCNKNPTNPYGESKLWVEKALFWYWKIYNISSVSLRYFNAAGASLDFSLGEDHKEESHIIPNAIMTALTGSEFSLFGVDYQTFDGTCVRDYIHVIDLVTSHMLSLNKLTQDKGCFVYNVGTGKGYSNKEVLSMIKRVSGVDFKIIEKQRRAGDADRLIADVTKINNDLSFKPQYSDLETIVKSAWEWHKKISKLKTPFGPSSGRGQNSK